MFNLTINKKKKRKKKKGYAPNWANHLKVSYNSVHNPMLKTNITRESALTNPYLGRLVIKNPFIKNTNFMVKSAKGVKKKDLNWVQALQKDPRLDPFGDADKDGVRNMFDCKPFDKSRQGYGHKKKKKKKLSNIQKRIIKLKSLSSELKTGQYVKGEQLIQRQILKEVGDKTYKKLLTESELKAEQRKEAMAPSYEKEYKRLQKEEYNQAINDQEKLRKGRYKELIKEKRKEIYEKSAMGRAQKRAKFEAGVAGIALGSKYSKEKQELGKKISSRTKGVYNALTSTAGIRELSFGEGGGFGSAGSGGSRGRPRGTYDPRYAAYGGVLGYRRYLTEQNRRRSMMIAQMEMQRMRAQAQSQQQVPTQNVTQYSPEQVQQTQVQYVPQPAIPMNAQQMRANRNLQMVYQRQQMMGEDAPAVVQQTPKGNPWGLLARWRPNLKANIFKDKRKSNLMSQGPNLIKQEPILRRVPVNQQGQGLAMSNSMNPNISTTQPIPQEYIDQNQQPMGNYQNEQEEGNLI